MVAPRKLPALRALYDRASPIGAPEPPHPDYSQDPFHMVLIRGIALPGNATIPRPRRDRYAALAFNVVVVFLICLCVQSLPEAVQDPSP